MSQGKIVVKRVDATTNKLTISKARVELKVRKDVTEVMEKWLACFMGIILRDFWDKPPEKTLRGRFRKSEKDGVIYIDLACGVDKKHVKRYRADAPGIPQCPGEL